MTNGFALIDSRSEGDGIVQNSSIALINGIDLSAYGSNPLNLQFTEYYRLWKDTMQVLVSNDGGVSWTSFDLNYNWGNKANSESPEYETVSIYPAIGSGSWGTDVRIEFTYKGMYDWFWAIDDVAIVEPLQNDLRLNAARWHFGDRKLQYTEIDPLLCLAPPETVSHEAIISNIGTTTQYNLKFTLDVDNGGYIHDSMVLDSLSVGEQRVVSMLAVNPGNVTSTNGFAFKVYSDSMDHNSLDNEIESSIETMIWRWGRDADSIEGFFPQYDFDQDGYNDIYEVGNIFEAPAQTGVLYASSISVMIDDATPVGTEVYGAAYSLDATGYWVLETTSLDHSLSAGDLSSPGNEVWLTLPLNGWIQMDTSLSRTYLFTVGYYYDSVYFCYSGEAVPTSAYMLKRHSSGIADEWSPIQKTPKVRINGYCTDIEEHIVSKQLVAHPNPARSLTNIGFELRKSADLHYRVVNSLGQLIEEKEIGRFPPGLHSLEYDVSNLKNGIYMYFLSSGDEAIGIAKLIVGGH